ncbi:MAG: hypothetical protein A2W99_16570 [Bacteroidetes bacterium GWF2_33_16]|nr:MAG: hypothetical protein A2X00_14225 [Bacteroidetes bacterium GWE2_32_14]OFY03364.1 MAG: hypothetical protein A2W99_16570 [Bacteroidetes bacterium GWF2_33_16]
MKKHFILVIILFVFCNGSIAQQTNKGFPKPPLLFLDQNPPFDEPQVFAKNIVSLDDKHEYCIAFSPDGREIYFSRAGEGIMVSIYDGSEWTKPQKAAFGEQYKGGELHITYDGKKLLMNRYAGLDSNETGGIWALQKTNNGWGKAQFLIPMGMRATSTYNGSIYTTDISGYRITGKDGGVISYWIPTETGYQRGLDPDGGVNTDSIDSHPFIAPDESYLIFNSRRDGGYGESDLYICYRLPNGKWSEAINMTPLNSEYADWCATVSPDRKYLFFTRNIKGKGDIFWVDAKIIEELKPKELK